MQDWSAIKDKAAIIQSLAVTIAVIVGGAWSLVTFWALGTKTKAELELFRQGVVNIKVEASQIKLPDDGYYISAVASVTNAGNRNTFLEFKRAPFVFEQISFSDAGEGQGRVTNTAGSNLSFGTLRKDATQQYLAFVKVPNPGLYVVHFFAPLDKDERPLDMAKGYRDDTYWIGSTSVIVR